MKSDVLRLICEDNMTMNQVVNSNTIRRPLSQNYPSEQPLPESGTTVTKYLRGAAAEVREKLRIVFKKVAETGSKLSISFDDATMLGSDRYSTLNVYHYEELLANSRVAALGLIRVEERATGLVIGIIHTNAQGSRILSCGYRQRLGQFIRKPHIVSLQVFQVGRCHLNMVGDQREFSSISSRSGVLCFLNSGILEKYLTRTLKNIPGSSN